MSIIKVRHCSKTNADISLAYETFGDPSTGHPIFLVSGLNCHYLYWPTNFCQKLAYEFNFFVVRFDNRDIGHSTRVDHVGEEGICSMLCCSDCCVSPHYSLDDMALDCLALVEKLLLKTDKDNKMEEENENKRNSSSSDKLPKKEFSLCAISMGGAISQCAAAIASSPSFRQQVPQLKLKSVTLMFTFPGDPKYDSSPRIPVLRALIKAPKNGSREAFIDNMMNMSRVCFVPKEEWKRKDNGVVERYVEKKSEEGTTSFVLEKTESTLEHIFENFFGDLYDRAPNEQISSRQRGAIWRQRPRLDLVKANLGRKNGINTLMFGATKDEVVNVSQSRLLHKLIPGAKYIEFAEAGHAMLPRTAHFMAEEIAMNAGLLSSDERKSVVPDDATIFDLVHDKNSTEPFSEEEVKLKKREAGDTDVTKSLLEQS